MQRCPSHGEATFSSLLVERCQIPISTVVARRDAIIKAGMFDETLLRCDDYDMWVRTAFHGAKIAYTRKIQARMPVGRPGFAQPVAGADGRRLSHDSGEVQAAAFRCKERTARRLRSGRQKSGRDICWKKARTNWSSASLTKRAS